MRPTVIFVNHLNSCLSFHTFASGWFTSSHSESRAVYCCWTQTWTRAKYRQARERKGSTKGYRSASSFNGSTPRGIVFAGKLFISLINHRLLLTVYFKIHTISSVAFNVRDLHLANLKPATLAKWDLNSQLATRNSQLATLNSQPATRSWQLATRSSQLAARNPQPATCKLGTCSLVCFSSGVHLDQWSLQGSFPFWVGKEASRERTREWTVKARGAVIALDDSFRVQRAWRNKTMHYLWSLEPVYYNCQCTSKSWALSKIHSNQVQEFVLGLLYTIAWSASWLLATSRFIYRYIFEVEFFSQ